MSDPFRTPLTPVEIREVESRTALNKALAGLVTIGTLIVLVWGIGGFVLAVARG